jgi:hypothetical protein
MATESEAGVKLPPGVGILTKNVVKTRPDDKLHLLRTSESRLALQAALRKTWLYCTLRQRQHKKTHKTPAHLV